MFSVGSHVFLDHFFFYHSSVVQIGFGDPQLNPQELLLGQLDILGWLSNSKGIGLFAGSLQTDLNEHYTFNEKDT